MFGIGTNVFRELITKTIQIIDHKLTKDYCDLLFKSVNNIGEGGSNKAGLNPINQLVRFEFLEIFIKMAFKKYFDSGD